MELNTVSQTEVIDVNGRVLIDLPQEDCPVLHHFSPGLCIREVHLKGGTFAVGHAQKFEHLNVMLKGAVAMLEDGKVRVLRAPAMYVGKPGRKIGFILEDTVWQNVYPTDLKDPEAVEGHFIDKTEAFKEYQTALLEYAHALHEEDRADYARLLAALGKSEETVRAQVKSTEDQVEFDGPTIVTIRDSAIQGKGVFLSASVKAGEHIAMSRVNGKRTPVGRYTNHAKLPNARMQKLNNGDIELVALRDIAGCAGGGHGEEVTVNYAAALLESHKPIVNEPRVIGNARTFDDVKAWLSGKGIVLFPQMAQVMGEHIEDGATVYNMEPLYPGCYLENIGFLDVLRRCRVFDYQKKNVEYLKSKGVSAMHLPYGYHPFLTRIEPGIQEDIDVLFFGGVNDRRIPVLKELEQSGMNVKIVTYGCFGKELDDVVARAKVVLNFHYQASHPLEVVRLNYLLANKKFVVTERGWDDEDNALYEPGVVYAEYDDLVRTCREYLDRPEERARIAEAGFALVKRIIVDLEVV